MTCPICSRADIELRHTSLQGDEFVVRYWFACDTHGFKWSYREERRLANDLDRARWRRDERKRKARGYAETDVGDPVPEYKTVKAATCPQS